MAADIEIGTLGFAASVKPVSEAGKEWVAENIPADAQWWAGAVVVEFPYLDAIIEGAMDDGLEVA